jgi:hypothetical protein
MPVHTKSCLFLIVFTLLNGLISAQDSTGASQGRFFIGATISPDYCYRTLSRNKKVAAPDYWDALKEFNDSIDRPKFSFTTGFNFGYKLNEKFSLESGLFFSDKGYSTIPVLTLYGNLPSSGSVSSNLIIVEATNSYHNYNLDVPFKANYLFLKNKLKIIVSAGADLNLFLQSADKVTPVHPSGSIQTKTFRSTDHERSVNVSPEIGAGFMYSLNENLDLRAEPSFRYEIFGIAKFYPDAIRFWSAGINFGLVYYLKK